MFISALLKIDGNMYELTFRIVTLQPLFEGSTQAILKKIFDEGDNRRKKIIAVVCLKIKKFKITNKVLQAWASSP